MDAYDRFAPYYDAFYAPLVDYAGDVRWLLEAFRRHAEGPVRRVLDLGCGTGTHALGLAREGLSVDGLDRAPRLLAQARAKAATAGPEVAARLRFHEGDMTEALPPGPFDAAVSMFGAFAYLAGEEQAGRALRLARDALAPRGLLVFEFWSPYGFRPAPRWDEAALPDGRRMLRLTTPRLRVEDDVYENAMEHLVLRGDALEERFVERHALQLRTPAATAGLLARHGFEAVAFTQGAREGKNFLPPGPDTFRVMCVARRT